jgi:hypothetical protein
MTVLQYCLPGHHDEDVSIAVSRRTFDPPDDPVGQDDRPDTDVSGTISLQRADLDIPAQ